MHSTFILSQTTSTRVSFQTEPRLLSVQCTSLFLSVEELIREDAGVASGGCISAHKGLHLCLQGVAFPPSRGCISETHEVALLSSGGCITARRGLHKGLHRFLSRGCIGILSLVKGLHRGFHFSPQGVSPLAGGCIRGLRRRSQGVAFKQAADDSQPPSATLVIFTAYRLSTDKFSITGWYESTK